jgi:hypothetical protein
MLFSRTVIFALFPFANKNGSVLLPTWALISRREHGLLGPCGFTTRGVQPGLPVEKSFNWAHSVPGFWRSSPTAYSASRRRRQRLPVTTSQAHFKVRIGLLQLRKALHEGPRRRRRGRRWPKRLLRLSRSTRHRRGGGDPDSSGVCLDPDCSCFLPVTRSFPNYLFVFLSTGVSDFRIEPSSSSLQ